MAGGVGGLVYSVRGGDPSYNLYDSRGDVVAKANAAGTFTWQASYEAYGTRTGEAGANLERQRANPKGWRIQRACSIRGCGPGIWRREFG